LSKDDNNHPIATGYLQVLFIFLIENKIRRRLKMYKMMIAVVLIFSVSILAQQNNNLKVPDNVSKAFQIAHPKAENVSWDKEGMNYEANYKESGNNFSVVINNDGNILETESEIDIPGLPPGVVSYINNHYKNYTLSGAAKIVDNKGNVKYEAEIKNGKSHKDVMFDKDGKPLLKKESKKQEAEKKKTKIN
jgi:hypothetical protein